MDTYSSSVGQTEFEEGTVFFDPHTEPSPLGPQVLPTRPTSCRGQPSPRSENPATFPGAGSLQVMQNWWRGQSSNTPANHSCYSVWYAEIRTWDNEISLHLVITPSSQPETKRIGKDVSTDGPVASIDPSSPSLLLLTLTMFPKALKHN